VLRFFQGTLIFVR